GAGLSFSYLGAKYMKERPAMSLGQPSKTAFTRTHTRINAASFAAILLASVSSISVAHAQDLAVARELSDAQARVAAARAELDRAQAELAQAQVLAGEAPQPGVAVAQAATASDAA